MTSNSSDDQQYDFAIVGMGIGGLTLGALLASAGKKVIAFEQHYVPGGYGHTFRQGRFSFCAELHYVWDCAPGERVYRVLEKLGLESEVSFNELDPLGFDRIVGPDVDYTIGRGFERETERLSKLFPEHATGLKKYFGIIETIHHQMYELPLGFTWRTVFGHPQRYSHISYYLRWTLEDLFNQLGFPPPLRLILAGQSAIFWLPPRDLSLLVQAAGVGSYNQGAYYPARSFMHVMKSLYGIIKRQPGCQALLRTEVTGIHIQDGKADRVTTASGDSFRTKHVLFDGDAKLSLDLIGREYFPKSFLKKLDYDYGASVVSIYLGLEDFDLRRRGFDERNIFWHPHLDLNRVYDEQFTDQVPRRPYFFCNAPTLRSHDELLAPEGCDQLVMISPCRYGFFQRQRQKSESLYDETKQHYASAIIDVLESEFAPDLSRHIVEKVVGSPLTNEFYVRAPKGNCYSTPLDPKHVNLRRLNYRSPFPNLFYVGASSSLPGFATIIHFATMLYEKLTGDRV